MPKCKESRNRKQPAAFYTGTCFSRGGGYYNIFLCIKPPVSLVLIARFLLMLVLQHAFRLAWVSLGYHLNAPKASMRILTITLLSLQREGTTHTAPAKSSQPELHGTATADCTPTALRSFAVDVANTNIAVAAVSVSAAMLPTVIGGYGNCC